jgi:hypothetical protein
MDRFCCYLNREWRGQCGGIVLKRLLHLLSRGRLFSVIIEIADKPTSNLIILLLQCLSVLHTLLHILRRYSLLQAMLQSPPGPLTPHQYLLFIYENVETTQVYL